MLQKESYLYSGDNSRWLLLKIFHIYRNGTNRQGHASFITFSSIRKRKKRNYKIIKVIKKRAARPRKTFACILTTRQRSHFADGQYIQFEQNLAASFTRRIIKLKLKVKTPCFYNNKRTLYISRARCIL